ncbi:MAG: transporter [Amphiplicatus sp.]
MRREPLQILYIASALALMAAPAAAQSTSAVSSPKIEPGEREFGYRLAFAVEDGGAPSAFAHRFHYQQAVTDNLRLRLVGSFRDRADAALDFTSIAVEARWQLIESEAHGWDGGLIFHLTVPASTGRPERFRLGFPASKDITPRWQARAVIFTGFEIGDGARPGALLEARAETTYKLANGLRVGPQLFSDFNTTAKTGSFDEQSHQLGFVVKGALTERLSYDAGALFGVSEAASDANLRLFLSYKF